MKGFYNVVVVGAGPSGLSVASEVSKEMEVLVIDGKKTIDDCKKSWFVPQKAIVDGGADDILPYTYNGVTRFFTNTFGGANVDWQAYGKYPYLDEKKLLNYWGEKVEENGSKIELDNMLFDFEEHSDYVELITEKGRIKTKLLIDASGTKSIIKSKYGIKDKALYYWSVYGSIIKFEDGLPEGLNVGDYQLWQTFADTNINKDASMVEGRPIFEYEVLDENTAFAFIFYLKKDMVEKSYMKKVFFDVMEEKGVKELFESGTYTEVKCGWYPSGGAVSPMLGEDRISFVGDAGCWTTPCGWGATTIIANYKHYSKKIVSLIKEDKLSKTYIKEVNELDMYTKNQFRMNQLVTHFLAHAPASLLDEFINLFKPGHGPLKSRGPRLCEEVFTLALNQEEIGFLLKGALEHFNLLELAKIMPLSDFANIIKTSENLIEVSLVDKFKKLLHSINPHIAYEDKFEDGFTF